MQECTGSHGFRVTAGVRPNRRKLESAKLAGGRLPGGETADTLIQLNRGEGRHSLGRAVFHGKRGELRQRYREGQEDQLGALGLVVNMIVLWNTIYTEAALEQLGYLCPTPEKV